MGLDYVPREVNTIADSLAKEASSDMGMGDKNYKFYFKLENVMENIKLPNQKSW